MEAYDPPVQAMDRIQHSHTMESGGGFIAGTQVWTDHGLVPIEQLKVGGSVLSQPEETGQRMHRKVMRVFSSEDQAILCVRYCLPPPHDGDIHYQYATGNQRFWIEGEGWVRADLLDDGQKLELHSGHAAYVLEVVHIYKTDRPNVGWMPEYSHSVDGFEIDFGGNREWWLDEQHRRNFGKSLGSFRTLVYSIEAGGLGSYYVGALGVLVSGAESA